MRPLEILSTLRLPDGRRWIEAAHDWQLEDARQVLDGDRPYTYLTRSRGSSKTTDLAGAAVSDLLAADGRLRSYWLAADASQAGLAVDAIAGFRSRTPTLEGRLKIDARRVIVPATGAVLEILPADTPGAWGLTPDRVYVDELANWADGPAARRLWEAASSAVAKRSDARLAVLTTAGSPDHWAYKVLEHARTSLLWCVSERLGPAPWLDADRLAEQKARLPHAVYQQLFENLWTVADGSFLDPAMIDAAFSLEGPALQRQGNVGGYVAGLDLGTVNDRTVFALGHREGDTILLDRMETWQGSRQRPVDFATVEAFIVEAHRRFGLSLRLDPWQGLDLAQRLRARAVSAEEFTVTSASKQRLAATLLSTVNNGQLRLYEAEGLRDELIGLRLVQSTSGAWSFDHKASGHDDRAVALALMVTALVERGSGEASLSAATGRLPTQRQALQRPKVPRVASIYPPGTPAWQRMTRGVRGR